MSVLENKLSDQAAQIQKLQSDLRAANNLVRTNEKKDLSAARDINSDQL